MKCPNCHIKLDGEDEFCPDCGHKIDKDNKCKECGGNLSEEDEFCPECGVKVSSKHQEAKREPAKPPILNKTNSESEKIDSYTSTDIINIFLRITLGIAIAYVIYYYSLHYLDFDILGFVISLFGS